MRPARADGLQLIGEMQGSGYRVPPALVRRGDGQTLQLTPLLYAVLEAVDGTPRLRRDRRGRSRRAPAGASAATTSPRSSTPSCGPSGCCSAPTAAPPSSSGRTRCSGCGPRYAVTDPERTRRLTDPFRVLFSPVVWVPVMAVFAWHQLVAAAGQGARLGDVRGVPAARPAPARVRGHRGLRGVPRVRPRGGGAQGRGAARGDGRRASTSSGRRSTPTSPTATGSAGPAGSAPTSAASTSTRSWRSRSSASGAVTRWDALLLVVATQILQMVRQLTPLVRFDGYHVLADLTGVPDLFSRIGPTLRVAVADAVARPEGPRAQAVGAGGDHALGARRRAAAALRPRRDGPRPAPARSAPPGRACSESASSSRAAVGDAEVVDALGGRGLDGRLHVPGPGGRAAPVAVRPHGRHGGRGRGPTASRSAAPAPRWSRCALVAGLAWAWWPRRRSATARSRPYEGGTLAQPSAHRWPGPGRPCRRARRPPARRRRGRRGLGEPARPGRDRPPRGTELPGEDAPVAGPRARSPSEPATATDDRCPTWVFPFDQPLPPGEGDNQALAVNTTDGTRELRRRDGDGLGRRRRGRPQHQRGLRAGELLRLRHGRGRLPGRRHRRPGRRRGAAEPRRGRQLRLLRVHHRRASPASSSSPSTSLPGRGGAARARRPLGGDRRVRRDHPAAELAEIVDRLEEYKEEILDILGEVVATASPPADDAEATTAPEESPGATPSGSAGRHRDHATGTRPRHRRTTEPTGEPAQEPAPTATGSGTPAPTPTASSTP